MPRETAQSKTPPIKAPDWASKASFPTGGLPNPKLAFSPRAGTQMPRQLGPMMRRQ